MRHVVITAAMKLATRLPAFAEYARENEMK
jgi:hypothetical protein